ncbi:MAG: pitrilysin family protein [Xanthomonadales bacterium]|nr:pitrilysin family protein [Xanthomonadales bacterium]
MSIALLFGAQGFAQDEAAKETPPEGGTPKDFVLPATDSYTLDNGLQVTLVPFGTLPKVAVEAVIRVGNLNDGEQTWIADLTADMLEEGTTERSSVEVAQAAASMGGEVDFSVGLDQTTVGGDVLGEFAPDLVELIAEVVRQPAFPEEELERVRNDRLRALAVAKTQPQSMAAAEFAKALYGDHPYGRYFPSEEQLAGYTIDDVRRFYADNFGAQRTQLFVVGQFDASTVKSAIETAFGDWEKGPAPLVMLPEPAEGKQAVDIVNRADASQSNVIVGLPVPPPGSDDWIKLQVTNTLLGGAFSSRITSNIREDKGYTYSPNSSLSTRYKDAYWAESAAVTTEVTGPALDEIYKEIDRLQNEPPSAEELRAFQNYMAGVFTLQNSTRSGIINMLNYTELHDLGDDYLTTYVSNVYAVTPEEVSETAEKYLREEDMTVVIVGDRAQISEQVGKYVKAE